MIYKTALDGEGIFQLGLIQDFFKRMRIPLPQIAIIGEIFNLDFTFNRNFWADFDRKISNSIIEFSVSQSVSHDFENK